MYVRSIADAMKNPYWYLLTNIQIFCDTLLSEQRLQMENLWIEYLLRDTIVERGARSSFTQNVPIFQFTIYTQHCLSFPRNLVENIVVKEWNPPPFPLKILTSNFGQTLNLYCLGHNNMEMDGMASPNCARCTFQKNALKVCTL